MIPKKIAKNIVPRVRPSWWFEGYVIGTIDTLRSEDDEIDAQNIWEDFPVYSIPYEDNLSIGFAYQSKEDSYHIITKNHIKEWKVSDEEILEIAIQNISSRGPHFTQIRPGVFCSNLNNTCDSCLMLLKDGILSLDLKGDPMVFFLSRDCMLVVGSDDADGLMCCLKEISAAIDNKGVIIQSYILENNKWLKAELHGENENIKEYNFLVLDEIKTSTNYFFEQLQYYFPERVIDIKISNLKVISNGKEYCLHSTWSDCGNINWIPKSDILILISREELEDGTIDKEFEEQVFSWERVIEVCSSYIRKLDFDHEIWEFSRFPTQEEIDMLTKLSYPEYTKPSKFKRAATKFMHYMP